MAADFNAVNHAQREHQSRGCHQGGDKARLKQVWAVCT